VQRRRQVIPCNGATATARVLFPEQSLRLEISRKLPVMIALREVLQCCLPWWFRSS